MQTASLGAMPGSEAMLPALDLKRYATGYLTWIANKLSRSASQHYLKLFDIGIETWRCMALLAAEGSVSAQQVSRVIGMDKGSVSRCFKTLQARGLIRTALDEEDSRIRLAQLTPQGQALHARMLDVALARERALLSALQVPEIDLLIVLLQRLHENLPAVEAATQAYMDQRGDGLCPAAQA